MSSLLDLLRMATSASDAENFWATQTAMIQALEVQEGLIRKREAQHSRVRASIREYARTSNRTVNQLPRLQSVLDAVGNSDDFHRSRRNTILYVGGDTLAFKLLPEHFIRVLGRNERPGFFTGKSGRKLELECAAYAVEQGQTVLLHDLTHCLRIGDLTIYSDETGPLLVEAGTQNKDSAAPSRRKERQRKRGHLAAMALAERFKEIDTRELTNLKLPSGFVEMDSDLEHHALAFAEATDLGGRSYKIVRPEEHLFYIAATPGCPAEEFMPKVGASMRDWRGAVVSCLRDRVNGEYSWVPPITLLDIPQERLLLYLEEHIRVFVFLDLGYVEQKLATAEIPLKLTTTPTGHFMLEVKTQADLKVYIGLKPLEHVQYGLATLASAINLLEKMAETALPYFGCCSIS